MKGKRVLWTSVLIISAALLIVYCSLAFIFYGNGNYGPFRQRGYGQGYDGRGMMGRGVFPGGRQAEGVEKLSPDRIRSAVNDYIKGYGGNLEVSDIFVFKDTDYYVSVAEKDTGKGAMELLVNPYTGEVYPEMGPNVMWNEKYRLQGGYGMMGGRPRKGYYNYNYSDSARVIERSQAVSIADKFVKDNMGKDFSVPGDGHEFYGYYTLHINRGGSTVGMLSVNYHTGDVWYHNWHGEIEQVISENKK